MTELLTKVSELARKADPNGTGGLRDAADAIDSRLTRIGSVVTDVTNVILNVRKIDFEAKPAESMLVIAHALNGTADLLKRIPGASQNLQHVAAKFTSLGDTVSKSTAIASFQFGQLVGSLIPDSRLLASYAGSKAGAAIGTIILPGIGTLIGGISGALGGLFGSRSADLLFKAQRLAADQLSQSETHRTVAAFWIEVLGNVQYEKLDQFNAFANDLQSRINNDHETYTFEDITIHTDQTEALVYVGATLARRELQKFSNLTSLEQIPVFGRTYRDFITHFAYVEDHGNVRPVTLEEKASLLTMAGLSVQQPTTPPAPPEPLPTAHYVGFLDDVASLEPVSFEQEPLGPFSVIGSTPLASPGQVVLSHRGTAFVLYRYSYENLRGVAEIDPVSQTVLRMLALPTWENSRWTYTNTLALSPDQNFLVVGSVPQVTFSRDGLRLFVGDNRGWSGSRIVEIDMVSRQEVRSWTMPVDGYTGSFTLGPDEDRFFLFSESTNKIGVLHMATREFAGLVDLPFTVRFATVDPTSRLLWIVDHTNSKIWKFDLATEKVAGSVSVPYGANHLAVSRTGSYVIAVSAYTGMLTVLDAADLSIQ